MRNYKLFLWLEDVMSDTVAAHTDCRLGKWYITTKTKAHFDHLQEFKELNKHHADVHNAAATNFHNGQISQTEDDL